LTIGTKKQNKEKGDDGFVPPSAGMHSGMARDSNVTDFLVTSILVAYHTSPIQLPLILVTLNPVPRQY